MISQTQGEITVNIMYSQYYVQFVLSQVFLWFQDAPSAVNVQSSPAPLKESRARQWVGNLKLMMVPCFSSEKRCLPSSRMKMLVVKGVKEFD